MRRVASALLFSGLLIAAIGPLPADACHFGGVGCGDPEDQPFNPVPSITLSNNRVGAHPDTTVTIRQQAHEQFIGKLVVDFDAAADLDLDRPAFNEKIADLTVRAIIAGLSTTLNGRIFDHNDPGHGHPAGGVYHWLAEIDDPAGGAPTVVDVFAHENAADGHPRFEFTTPQSLINDARMVDASLQEITTKFLGSVAAGPFLTNPQLAGTYTTHFHFEAYDSNGDGNFDTNDDDVSTKIIGPTSLTLVPETATNRVGETLSLTATVRDQDGNTMSGVAVRFDRTGANPGTETKTTNASGQASHAYAAGNDGTDTIVATATLSQQQSSDTSTATWYVPEATTIVLEPSTATKTVGSTHTVTATVKDQQGRVLSGVGIAFDVSGANTASGAGTTDANGKASFSYTGSEAGDDTITATADGVSASATATWTTQQQCQFGDSDCDGVPNQNDNCDFAANPDQADADGDGFGNACDSDDDNDSLQDAEETPNGCNPFDRDTDDDGLTDWQEVKGYKTNCADPDTDDDTLSDYEEVFETGSDPKKADTDGDGVRDDQDPCPRIRGTSCITIKIP